MKRMIWLVILSVVSPALGAIEADEHTLFLCHFEDTAQADFSVGSPHPLGVAAFVPGRVGKALFMPLGFLPFAQSVAPITTGVQYASAGNINLRQGTIELWAQPLSELVQTTEKSPKLRYLLSSGKYVEGNHGFALVLSHFDGKPGEPYGLVWTRQNGSAKEKIWTISYPLKWQIGEWHHIAVTYSPQEDRLYVDGKLQGRLATGEGMDFIGERFAVGASIYHSYVADCVLDELRISDIARYTQDFTPNEAEPKGTR